MSQPRQPKIGSMTRPDGCNCAPGQAEMGLAGPDCPVHGYQAAVWQQRADDLYRESRAWLVQWRLERRLQYRRDKAWLEFYRSIGLVAAVEWLDPRLEPLMDAMDRFAARHPRLARVGRAVEWVGLLPWRFFGLAK